MFSTLLNFRFESSNPSGSVNPIQNRHSIRFVPWWIPSGWYGNRHLRWFILETKVQLGTSPLRGAQSDHPTAAVASLKFNVDIEKHRKSRWSFSLNDFERFNSCSLQSLLREEVRILKLRNENKDLRRKTKVKETTAHKIYQDDATEGSWGRRLTFHGCSPVRPEGPFGFCWWIPHRFNVAGGWSDGRKLATGGAGRPGGNGVSCHLAVAVNFWSWRCQTTQF